MNVIHEGKVHFELWPYFCGAKLRSIAVGNNFCRLSAKCAGSNVFESRHARYGNRQVGVGTKRCAELASHVVHSLIESPCPEKR